MATLVEVFTVDLCIQGERDSGTQLTNQGKTDDVFVVDACLIKREWWWEGVTLQSDANLDLGVLVHSVQAADAEDRHVVASRAGQTDGAFKLAIDLLVKRAKELLAVGPATQRGGEAAGRPDCRIYHTYTLVCTWKSRSW